MCGVAGYVGLERLTQETREWLVYCLGIGVDTRGRHAHGFAARLASGREIVSRRLGPWEKSSDRMIARAASGASCIMHARYATMGARDEVTNAHPFTVKRRGSVVLRGAHNGMLTGTYASAADNDRDHTVDSRELFELLADGDLEAIRSLNGYGVLTYYRASEPDIRLTRISADSDIYVASIVGGGIIYGSTKAIVHDALEATGLIERCEYRIDPGIEYRLSPDGIVYETHNREILVGARESLYSPYARTTTYAIWDDVEENDSADAWDHAYLASMRDDRDTDPLFRAVDDMNDTDDLDVDAPSSVRDLDAAWEAELVRDYYDPRYTRKGI